MGRLFDTYLFIDWSASNRPTKVTCCPDAIWIGELNPAATTPRTAYCRTRHEAVRYVRERLECHVDEGRRVLIGFDFPYGYPQGTARSLGLGSKKAWLGLWKLLTDSVKDDPRNVNNRWQVASQLNERISPETPGPFWGCPKGRQTATLTSRKNGILEFPYETPSGALARERFTERHFGRTQEVWKLLGAGSVGSQTLVGIPHVHALRFAPALGDHSFVWPFETGFSVGAFADRQPVIVHTEIWPGIVESAVQTHQAGRIRDQVQVEQLCLWAAREDAAGRLGARLEQPSGLSKSEIARCTHEEGWILGAQ